MRAFAVGCCLLLVAACTGVPHPRPSTEHAAPATGPTALGRPDCRPPSPITRGAGFPEVEGTGDRIRMWGLIMAAHSDNPVRVHEEVKIVWRITGSGALHLVTIGPDGRRHPLLWGAGTNCPAGAGRQIAS